LHEAERRSDGHFQLKEGTIYPALQQMLRAGLLRADVRVSETGYPRKHYSLTAEGRRAVQSKREQWEALSAAMRLILKNSHDQAAIVSTPSANCVAYDRKDVGAGPPRTRPLRSKVEP
jgi:DNA-binding PadR family transcriptional regulator